MERWRVGTRGSRAQQGRLARPRPWWEAPFLSLPAPKLGTIPQSSAQVGGQGLRTHPAPPGPPTSHVPLRACSLVCEDRVRAPVLEGR